MKRALGIDLGTSNSAIAVIDDDGRPRILTTEEGNTTMPSLVWFSPDGPVVGEPARAGFEHSPEVTIYGIKRLLGRRFDHREVQRLSRVLPYQLLPAPNGDVLVALSSGRTISPEEITALILRELRRMAEHFFGEIVDTAVITVPAWFDASQRQATKDAATIAGMSVRRLLSEPTAAALGYGAHRGENRRYMVCDLGGGTFDVAVVDVEQGVFEVISTTGDPFLGGDDIDRAIVEHLVRDVRASKGVDVSTDATAIDRLRLAAQAAKHELSMHEHASISIADLCQTPSGRPITYQRTVRRDELQEWASVLLARLEPPCKDALGRAGRDVRDVDQVLLVGGSTRMPAVQRSFERTFGKPPKLVPNPEEVVAVGAALEVARLDGVIDGILLIDVCARGISVSRAGGPCEVVVGPNAVVPTREQRIIPTTQAGQRRLEFDLWEGDSRLPQKNRHLGRYAVVDLPEAPAGDTLLVIEVMVDVDGTYRVDASELISGQRFVPEVVTHAGLPRAEVARLRRAWQEQKLA